jgi:hypothetical protein
MAFIRKILVYMAILGPILLASFSHVSAQVSDNQRFQIMQSYLDSVQRQLAHVSEQPGYLGEIEVHDVIGQSLVLYLESLKPQPQSLKAVINLFKKFIALTKQWKQAQVFLQMLNRLEGTHDALGHMLELSHQEGVLDQIRITREMADAYGVEPVYAYQSPSKMAQDFWFAWGQMNYLDHIAQKQKPLVEENVQKLAGQLSRLNGRLKEALSAQCSKLLD